jgi:hypothetical protein
MTPLTGMKENRDETTIIMGGGIYDAAFSITHHDRGLDDRGV